MAQDLFTSLIINKTYIYCVLQIIINSCFPPRTQSLQNPYKEIRQVLMSPLVEIKKKNKTEGMFFKFTRWKNHQTEETKVYASSNKIGIF